MQSSATLRAVASSLLSTWLETLPDDRGQWIEQDRVTAQCLEVDMAEMVIHASGVQTKANPKHGWFRGQS